MSDALATVYVIDDEISVQRALNRLLRSAGYSVRTFSSAAEFLNNKLSSTPDCLVLDIHLPEKSGIELQQELVAKSINLPVIFITGRDDPGLERAAHEAGGAAFFRKPFDDEELLSALSDALKKAA